MPYSISRQWLWKGIAAVWITISLVAFALLIYYEVSILEGYIEIVAVLAVTIVVGGIAYFFDRIMTVL